MIIDNYSFNGRFSKLCFRYIQHKRSIGYKFGERSIRAIRKMNESLSTSSENRSNDDYSITKEVVEKFVARKSGETPKTQEMRETVIRQFAMFLNSLSIEAYVVPTRKKSPSKFTPYIFTREQISVIFNVIDNLEYECRSPNYHYVYPFLIRLLYCCGLRISEALALKIEDVDFDEGVLRIEQAKYNNSRLVPISGSLRKVLSKYMDQVGYRGTDKGFMFRTRWNTPYKTHSIYCRFKAFLQRANIPYTENGRTPRLHDLRHTFAVHALEHMSTQGMDVYCSIPYLAAYMGHRKIKCTEQYLRLTAESYGGIIEALTPLYENLFLEVDQHEEA
jgi:integrase/recombinase XerD